MGKEKEWVFELARSLNEDASIYPPKSIRTHIAHEERDDGDADPGVEGPEVALARALVVQEDGAEPDAVFESALFKFGWWVGRLPLVSI